jgi:hypothetical protein
MSPVVKCQNRRWRFRRLLRARRDRPCCCAAEKRYEFAPLQSIGLHLPPEPTPGQFDFRYAV